MIFDLLRKYQLDIMLVLIGICGITAFFVSITGTLSKKRKRALVLVEISATILLMSDRLAYIYRGNTSTTGYWMVRISNFLVFFMTFSVVHAINLYVADLMKNEGTGLYYTFDENNRYVRAPGFIISYIMPSAGMLIMLAVIFRYRHRLRRLVRYPLMLFFIIPLIASVIQIFAYGLSLTNMSIVGMAVVLYVFVVIDMNVTVWRSHRLEVDYLKKQQKSMRRLFEQTATALFLHFCMMSEKKEFRITSSTRKESLRTRNLPR